MPRVLVLCPATEGAQIIDTGLVAADRESIPALDHLMVACPHCGDCHAVRRPFLEGEPFEGKDSRDAEPSGTKRVVLDMVQRQDGGYAEPAWVLEPIAYDKLTGTTLPSESRSDGD